MSETSETKGFRSGFVTIVGRPNVGKSTLLNAFLGQKLAIVTPKPQTTRDRIMGIGTWPECQIMFLDTPGIHQAKGLLHRMMVENALASLQEADAVILVVDSTQVKDHIPKPERKILEQIQASALPCILALNKVDAINKQALLPVLARMQELFPFQSMVPVSALNGQGVDDLRLECAKVLPEANAIFDEGELTDRNLSFVVREFVREQVFLRTQQEVPYSTAVTIDVMENREAKEPLLYIAATIHVERKSQKGILIGKGGSMLKAIGQGARESIEGFSGERVFLELFVRVEDEWTRSVRGIQKVGYET